MSEMPSNTPAHAKRQRRKLKVSPIGASPGTLIADPNALPPVLTLTLISQKKTETKAGATFEDLRKARGKWPVVWLDCSGLADVELIRAIGEEFNLHALALEDTVNTGSRPKADFYPDHVFIAMTVVDDAETHRYEQIALFFGKDFVVSFQERTGDPFGPVRKRIESSIPNRIRERKADYLAYALIDAAVDSYFPLVEQLAEKTDQVEDEMVDRFEKTQSKKLHLMRRGAAQLKRPLVPIRETVAALIRSDSPVISPDTKIFLNDTLDHTTTLIDLVDAQRDMLSGLIDMHLSLSQARTNDVISFLTIVSAIFIPLTFLAGIWGMNFEPASSPWNMPELKAFYGYPAALGFMLLVALAIVAFFKWKKWL